MTAGAVAFFADAPAAVIYPIATLTSMSVTLARPAHGAILPSLARTPAELTAANVASGTVQNASIAVAPIVAGLILTASGTGAVFLVCAAGVAARRRAGRDHPDRNGRAADPRRCVRDG